MPPDEPGAALSRSDIPGQNRQAATAQETGGRTVIVHLRMVSQPITEPYESRFSAGPDRGLYTGVRMLA